MSEPGRTGLAGWKRLGCLLPKDVRERIFEPAFADLIHRQLRQRSRRLPFGAYAIATGLACLPVAVRWLFVRNGSLTRFGRWVLLAIGTAAAMVLVLIRLTRVDSTY